MKIVVAGTGYVGLVTGVVLAHIGNNITCVDNNEAKIELMKNCISPIYEDGLEELMKRNKKRLKYTIDYKNAYKNADVIFVGVGTPENSDGSTNLDYVFDVCKNICEVVTNKCIVVIKSTVPVGTNEIIKDFFDRNCSKEVKIYVASNPEFLSQGTAVKDTLYASRIIIGSEEEYAKKVMRKIYKPLTKSPYNVPYIEMNRRSAEMVKYASNNFLALKISYINEIANFCEKVSANIDDIAIGMGYDSRIGKKFLNAGIGYGGSCFLKDTKSLYNIGKKFNFKFNTIEACIETNKKQNIILYEKLKQDFENLNDLTIAVLGLTFKPGTDDLRGAPSIDNILLLLENGVSVKAYDPVGIENMKKYMKNKIKNKNVLKSICYYTNIDDAIRNADAVMIMTDWPEIVNYNVNKYITLMRKSYVYDGRNCYNNEKMQSLKIRYVSIGRNSIDNLNCCK